MYSQDRVPKRWVVGFLLFLLPHTVSGCFSSPPPSATFVFTISNASDSPASTGSGFRQRFIIRIFDAPNFPCVGVSRIKIVLEATEPGQDPVVSERVVQEPVEQALFWDTTTGKCHLSEAIVVSRIPYGGVRRISMQLFDASAQMIAQGVTQPFRLEPEGTDVKDVIDIELVRGCRQFNSTDARCANIEQIALGTLGLRFPIEAVIPTGTRRLVLVLPPTNEHSEIIRRVDLVVSVPPTFLLFANIPAATDRKYEIYALDTQEKVQRKWGGSYTLTSNATPKGTLSWGSPALLP